VTVFHDSCISDSNRPAGVRTLVGEVTGIPRSGDDVHVVVGEKPLDVGAREPSVAVRAADAAAIDAIAPPSMPSIPADYGLRSLWW
jgi:hypothetical protein